MIERDLWVWAQGRAGLLVSVPGMGCQGLLIRCLVMAILTGRVSGGASVMGLVAAGGVAFVAPGGYPGLTGIPGEFLTVLSGR